MDSHEITDAMSETRRWGSSNLDTMATPVARALITIIDDDEVAQAWLHCVLMKHGYPSVCFGTAEAHFGSPSTDRPACVSADWKLKGLFSDCGSARHGPDMALDPVGEAFGVDARPVDG